VPPKPMIACWSGGYAQKSGPLKILLHPETKLIIIIIKHLKFNLLLKASVIVLMLNTS